MKHTVWNLICLCAVSCAFLMACGGKQAGSSSGASLVYWSMWNEAEPQGRALAEAVEAFSEETGIPVEINFNGCEIRKTLQPALDAGETIDIFDEDIDRVLNTWGSYLLPLDEYVSRSYPTTSGEPYSSVVNQRLLSLARDLGGGVIKNIPYQPSAFVVMYNKDLFSQAGIERPPLTWDEMLAACEKLKAIGVYGITVDDAYMAFLFGYCMDRLVGSEATAQMVSHNDFSAPQVLEFGRIWEEMAQKGYISPKAASNIFPAAQIQEIAAGKAAMYLNGTWLPNEIRGNNPNLNWGSFAWPAMSAEGDGIETNNFGSQSFGVNKNTRYPEEAFELIVWLTTGEWDERLAEESIGIPIANASEWPAVLQDARAIVENTSIRLPWAVGMEDNPEINAKIKENFAKLIKGDLDAQGFAAAMQK